MFGRATAGFLATCFMALSASAQTLEEFRGPNDLESAYVGVASALGDVALCQKISPLALNRTRKPTLTRSLCYYQTAIAISDDELCTSVAPVPADTGMMAWLDPQRCRQQVEALSGLDRPLPPVMYPETFLAAAGYTADKPAGEYLGALIADNAQELKQRITNLPDFSAEEEVNNGFTPEQAEREKNWVLSRALRLCISGRTDAECDESAITLVREDGLRKAGLLPPAEASGYRRLSNTEKVFLHLAESLRDASICDGIGKTALSVGWSQEPGLGFVPGRSACRMRVAALTRDPDACQGVAPIEIGHLDGARSTEAECRKLAENGEVLFPAVSREPDWSGFLTMLQYADGTEKKSRDEWRKLAAYLSNPLNKEHEAFRVRVWAASKWYSAKKAERDALSYTLADLQLSAHQFAATRFHCSLNWAEIQMRDSGQPKTYWTPEQPSFSLIDDEGKPVTEADFKGDYMLAYFGFTYCPDVCPISLSTIAIALNDLGDEARRIKPVFFTLDARRDTAPVLNQYMKNFGHNFTGLTGSAEAVDRAARSFNVYYNAGEIDGYYTVEHTSYFYLVDPDGRTVKYFEYGVDPHDMAAEVSAILAGEAPTPGGAVRHAATR